MRNAWNTRRTVRSASSFFSRGDAARMASASAVFHGESARRIIDLHGRDAEVRKDKIGARVTVPGENLRKAREVAAMRLKGFGTETERAQASLGLGQFHWIGIEADQPASGLNPRQDLPRMSAVAERAIHGNLPGRRGQDIQDFRDHDRTVRAGGRFPGGDDFLNRLRVELRIALLVFVLKPARIPARVTRAALMRGGRIGL